MSDRLNTTAKKSQNLDSTFKVSPFRSLGFGVQTRSEESSPATKAQLWENYQQAKQLNQKGANSVSVPIQAKLTILQQRGSANGKPGNKYEQEADTVADRVMAMSAPAQLQQEELPEEEDELQMKQLVETISPLVQREELPQEEGELQMKPEDNIVTHVVQQVTELHVSPLQRSESDTSKNQETEDEKIVDLAKRALKSGKSDFVVHEIVWRLIKNYDLDINSVLSGSRYDAQKTGIAIESRRIGSKTTGTLVAGSNIVQSVANGQLENVAKLIQLRIDSISSNQNSSVPVNWQNLEAQLKKSNRGREALQIKEQYRVKIEWKSGDAPASFKIDDKKHTEVCNLNPLLKLAVIASYFVHEMYHAQKFYTNQSPQAENTDEDTFVKQMVDEEIEGTIKQFEAKLELDRLGHSNNYAPGEEFYRNAYNEKKKEALKEGKSRLAAHQEGLLAGRRTVELLIRPNDGRWQRLGPSNFESYEMSYRREWKQKNKQIKH
ncbi:hypothetical protein [Chamaesiphon sp. VAR_48_metabat_403]|uniref:hypothetical protein n=1 Tax=Chamaesiphon sp. VAR_48_metabat_403 TaxID=2964700 RepID=UPI00286E9466|nr:hypothetical protein [Chamaesiphon sp. VAR_48_metabat_403]